MHTFRGLSGAALKYIGAFFMVIDHIGVIFLSGELYTASRILGRLAAPIFFFAISEGARYTKHMKKYLLILLGGGLLFHLVFLLVEGNLTLNEFVWGYKNIFFTLFLGLLGLAIIRKKWGNKGIDFLKWSALFIIPFIGEMLDVDYGAYGILFIYLFYFFGERKVFLTIFLGILNGVALLLGFILPIQLFSLVSLVFIFFYNGEKGRAPKYFFYIFYPVHLIILYGIQYVIHMV